VTKGAYIRPGDTLCCANSSAAFRLGNFYAEVLFSFDFTFSFDCGCRGQQYLTTNSIGGYTCEMPYRGPCKICVTNNNLLFTHEWKINGFGSLYRLISVFPTAGLLADKKHLTPPMPW
jgi:hypothetical protein